ncbi:plasmid partitioning protein RepA [Defluviimonas salinarum]|uniref:Plasmid partitioning protein RepA n=1 Tax=Defluviimonas salinarum TaxID=2992147 RepID=A0ABT3J9R7_9RHOB|nr:plasmid partitioning protein RepA [Defluviimonas salinarum]MCW3784441.1 plasmid partitioning protein RepA [Defluviimonas salinarum]
MTAQIESAKATRDRAEPVHMEPAIGVPPSEDVFDDLLRDETRLRASLDKHMRNIFAPEAKKDLRPFASGEVADLLGLSQTHLRKLHFDGRIPDVETDERGRKLYRAEDIHAIRVALARSAKDPLQFLPGRVGSDHLQVFATSTFKGGSGKTTAAIHLAQRFALKGYRVLAIDMDPQASLTTMMGLRPELDLADSGTIYDAIRYHDPVPMEEVVRKTYFHNLDIAPGGLVLSEYETETPTAIRQGIQPPFYLRLKAAIDQVEHRYDLVFIDCPPQLGFLTMSALVAATGLLITVIPNMIDVASLSQYLTMATSLLKVVERNDQRLDYDFMRYLLCRYEPSDMPQSQMASFLRMHFGQRLMTEAFLKSTAVSDAGLSQKTLFEANRGDMNRATLDRALESINSVANEFEQAIHHAWGRV